MEHQDRFLSNLLGGSSDAAELFLADWYGQPERGNDAPELELPVPPSLLRLYELAANWPQAIVQNRLLSPPEMADEITSRPR